MQEEEKKQLIDEWIKESQNKSLRRTKKSYLYSLIPILFGLLWLFFSLFQVRKLETEVTELNDSINVVKEELVFYENAVQQEKSNLELFKYLRDNLQVEYLYYLKNSLDENDPLYSNLQSSIKANEYLNSLMSNSKINGDIKIRYHIKDRDAERVKYSISELGYNNFEIRPTNNVVLLDGETNTIVYGDDIELIDIQVIALALIRTGFKVQFIFKSFRNSEVTDLIQIIRTAPSDGSPVTRPEISSDQIFNAKSIEDIKVRYPL